MGIAVLDIGTSSMRGILYHNEGKKLFTKQIGYTPIYQENGWVEQNPRDWRQAAECSMRACSEAANRMGETIQALSITAQRSSVIPVDERGQPLGNAIMWQDKRTEGILQELSASRGRIFELTGSRLNPVFSGCKMTWIRKNRPALYRAAKRLVVIPDYLIHEMTGEWVTDTTYASRSLLMNLRTRQWDEELLALFSVDREKLCQIIEPGSVAGRINRSFAALTGLKEGTPVISAGGDQQCAALGLGIIHQGNLEISAGTGAYIIAAADQVPDGLREDVICNTSAIPGRYVLESSILSCASVFNWFLRLCYGLEEGNKKQGLQRVNQEMEQIMDKKESLVVLPHFQGRGTPDWNSAARGSFCNMTLGAGRADLARAVLEGIGYEIASNIDVIRGYIGEIREIYACGGMINSSIFRRILASMCGQEIRTCEDNEATAVGAWTACAVALGFYSTYEAALQQARGGNPFRDTKPALEMVQRYQKGKTRYVRLYQTLRRETMEEKGECRE